MAAGLGFKTFTVGEILTAGDTNGYLMQGVLVFASSAARASAITSPQEGQYSYLKDTNSTEYYDGAAWTAAATGDVTGVTAGTGILVASPTGPVPTVSIDTAVTADLTTAQTMTNKTLTTPKISNYTTNGDLVYGTGSSVITRLGIGSTSQVLTVTGGVPVWATPSAGTPTFVGCSLYKSANASITNATDTTVTFNSENYDTDGFHDTATNAERITIPAGKGGKYLITAKITYASSTTGIRGIYLYKNAAVFLTYNSGNLQVSGECNVLLSYVVNLVATDYVYYQTYQNSVGALNLNGGSELTTFQASYLGA
jgi:hypothetical protein